MKHTFNKYRIAYTYIKQSHTTEDFKHVTLNPVSNKTEDLKHVTL